MKEGLFFGGLAVAGVTALAPNLLAQAPSSIQSNPVLQPLGSWLINNQTVLVIFGLVLILVSVFLK